MKLEELEIGKIYKLNKTINPIKCGAKAFIKGASVKVISSVDRNIKIKCDGFSWSVSAEDLDKIVEESNESKVNKLLDLRYATLRNKFTKWNCKIMKGVSK